RTQTQLGKRVDEVGRDEPHRAHQRPGRARLSSRHQYGEPGSYADEPGRKLDRARRLARAEAYPQPGEDRRERDDEERVRRLEPAAREASSQDGVPGGAIGEEVERRSRLLELGPEQGRRQKEDSYRVQSLALVRSSL